MTVKTISLEECGSTNDEAWKRLPAEGAADESVLVTARRQSAGRGRQGRSWVSAGDGNVLASVLLPPLSAERLRWLPLAAGVAAVETIAALAAPWAQETRLKWPNDLLLGGVKMGGILCESRFRGESCLGAVVGLGLNVGAAPALDDGRAAAALLPDATADEARAFADRFATAWAEALVGWRGRLERGDTEALRLRWQILARLTKTTYAVHDDAGRLVEITPKELTSDGKLRAVINATGMTVELDQAETLPPTAH